MNILEQIVSEASIEQLKQQFVDTEKITQEVFDEIVKATKGKGAYATWMVKRVEDGTIKGEDIYKYENYIEIFNKHKREFPSPDINAYKAYRRAVNKGLIQNKFIQKDTWSIDTLEQEAAKYERPIEFKRANINAYRAYRHAVTNGLIQDKFKQDKTTPAGPSTTTPQSTNPTQSSNLYNNPYFGNTTTTFDKLKENKMDNFDLKRFLVENKMTRNSQLLNEITNGQIIQFIQSVDPEGRQYIETYFENPGSYTIDGAIDYLTSHSSLFNNNPDPDDQDGGLSGFTQNDLIQYAQDAGWGRGEIDYMLDLLPVKYLERG
jgi:hypothetical protein